MKIKNLLVLLICILSLKDVYGQQIGEVVYTTGFDTDDDRWSNDGGRQRYVKKDGRTALMVKSGKLKLYIPASKYAGAKLGVKVWLKSNGVSDKPRPWNGIKLMVHVRLPWDDINQQVDFPVEPFEWKEEGFNAVIPESADTAYIFLGLEQVAGKVWFDSISVTVTEQRRTDIVRPAEVLYKGHNEKRLRGAMVSTDVNEDDLRTLASWGANHIRWQLIWGGFPVSKADTASVASYWNWVRERLDHLDGLLPICAEKNIKVLIDLHSTPGGKLPGVMTNRMFQEKEWQQVFKDVWVYIAQRYKNNPTIWGYDLANEPDEGIVQDGLMDWWHLATNTSKAIREIDTNHAIIMEGAPRGGPEALERMQPIPVDRVVYSFHMYVPAIFSLQGNGPDDVIRYPGYIQEKEWNIATMRKLLEQIRKWQKAYNTHIYIGEFSASRWAPGQSAYYYIRDCIDLFEEYGWDWAYHAYREWHGWSVEHGEDPKNENRVEVPTERQKLLMKYFAKNKE